jgi:hypothetical protein
MENAESMVREGQHVILSVIWNSSGARGLIWQALEYERGAMKEMPQKFWQVIITSEI